MWLVEPLETHFILLEDGELVRQHREQCKEWQTLQDFCETGAHWWEMVKGRTPTFFRRAGKRKKDRDGRHMLGVQRRMPCYFKSVSQCLTSKIFALKSKQQMKIFAEMKSRGVILRSKEKETEVGEKCTLCFLKKIVSKDSFLKQLRRKDGSLTTNSEERKDTVESFYTH